MVDYEVEQRLTNTINLIFAGHKINKLSQFQKRQMIFSYLCDNLEYDYSLLEKIQNHEHLNLLKR